MRAFQALAKGEAHPEQQTRALRFIVEGLCDTYGLSYRVTGDRDTVFAEGKRYVGLQLIKLTKLNLGALKEKDNDPRRRASSRTDRDPDRNPATEYGPEHAGPGTIDTSGRPRIG